MNLGPITFRIHRWLAWLVGLQLLIWVAGGLVFSLVPFKSWVKGGEVWRAPALVLPQDWMDRTQPALRAAATAGDVQGMAAVATPHGPALRLKVRGQTKPTLVLTSGAPWQAPDEAAVRAFAQTMYAGPGAVAEVKRLDLVPARLGLVQETGGRRDVWRVAYTDALGTRIYLDAHSGEFIAVRTEAWVWYDLFWRLHIMDYADGEDFNGTLLRVSAVLAGVMVAAGAVLAVLAARRRWRRSR